MKRGWREWWRALGDAGGLYWRVVVQPYLKSALYVVLLTTVGAALEAMTVGLAVPLLDAMMAPDHIPSGRFGRWLTAALGAAGAPRGGPGMIFVLLTLASTLFVAHRALAMLQQYSVASVGQRLRRETKIRLMERMLYAPYGELLSRGRAAILQDINRPSEAIFPAVQSLGIFMSGACTTVVLVTLMLYLSWWATLGIGVFVSIALYGVRALLVGRAMEFGRIAHELHREEARIEVDAIDGVKIVKAARLEPFVLARLRDAIAAEVRPTLRFVFFRNLPFLWNEVIVAVIVIALGAVAFVMPGFGMGLPTLVGLLVAMRRLSPAVGSLSAASVDLARARRSIEVVDEILHRLPQEPKGGGPLPSVRGIRFAGVGFGYAGSDGARCLDGVDLDLRRGEVTAVVGVTGSGKSTLAHLLVRLYEPDAGRILVDDVDLRTVDLGEWRRAVGFVAQDTFLFNGTLRENITLWDPAMNEADLAWATRVARVDDFVDGLPERYEAVVGDRGLKLSGGQAQRVAIARAVIRRPRVLVLDEATSGLDNLTERAVYAAIEELRTNAAVLVISHRLSTIMNADRIVVLQGGRVVEQGTHEALMARRGIYAELYEADQRDDRCPPSPGLALHGSDVAAGTRGATAASGGAGTASGGDVPIWPAP